MKKIIKYSFIAIIVIITVSTTQTAMNKFLDDRPIKFESYKTAESFEEAMRAKFPTGTNIDKAKKIIEQSGAQCITKAADENYYRFQHKDAKYITACSYRAYFLSDDPNIGYLQ